MYWILDDVGYMLAKVYNISIERTLNMNSEVCGHIDCSQVNII